MLTGTMIVGGRALRGTGEAFTALAAVTGEPLEPRYAAATPDLVDTACRLAAEAFDPFRQTDQEVRAQLLETIASRLEAVGDVLVQRAMLESGLPRPRVEGELARTAGQLRMFSRVLRDGGYLDLRIDPAQPDRKPLPRVDLRMRKIPLGPVAVFGASNFPLAFSVAGGDTASALAAGCPVVVKAHSAHPGTSEIVGREIQAAVEAVGLPAGVFALLYDGGYGIGQALVAHPAIKAVGFTGSRRGGLALLTIAQARPEPIPVYAEMSAVNPVLLLPAALAARGAEIGRAFASALTLGAGQFCTNPGVVLAVEGLGLDLFLDAAAGALSTSDAATMLTPGIHQAYCGAVAALDAHPHVRRVARGQPGQGHAGQAALFQTSLEAFATHAELREEVFGATSLVVRCPETADLPRLLESLEGQLTVAVHADREDYPLAAQLLPILERKAGRVLFNGFGVGVEVGDAMVHGGPFPAASDSRVTSVGSLAMDRFLRPVSYQDVPDELLPSALRAANPGALPRRVDGGLPRR
jgi:alpha-ketoglutaric semialdehyde dehydrogenase